MGERKIERETGAGREISRETGVGERETERERERERDRGERETSERWSLLAPFPGQDW